MAKMIVSYKTPKDISAFERHYFETHIPLAKKFAGLRKYEVSQGHIMRPVGVSDIQFAATLHFDDMAAISRAFASHAISSWRQSCVRVNAVGLRAPLRPRTWV